MAMLKKEKGHLRRKSWVLQFVTAFGLTFSVLCGFYGGYLLAAGTAGVIRRSRERWSVVSGLPVIYLAQEETTRKK